MLGSREVLVNEIWPCVPWAPSHPFHVMPPRITRNSHRPRASDRTMVDFESPFAYRSRKLDGVATRSRETYENRKAKLIAIASKPMVSGLAVEKQTPIPVEAELCS